MMRNYKKKRDTSVNEEDLKKAMQHVLNKTMTLRGAADAFEITKSTLGYRLKNIKNDKRSKSEDFSSKYSVCQVFTNLEKNMLENYMLKCSK